MQLFYLFLDSVKFLTRYTVPFASFGQISVAIYLSNSSRSHELPMISQIYSHFIVIFVQQYEKLPTLW